MFQVNDNFQKLPGSYLFSTIAKKSVHISRKIRTRTSIRLGIGDNTAACYRRSSKHFMQP